MPAASPTTCMSLETRAPFFVGTGQPIVIGYTLQNGKTGIKRFQEVTCRSRDVPDLARYVIYQEHEVERLIDRLNGL